MNKYEVILGVDVSKLTLDISCADRHLHLKIDNDSNGFNDLKKWFKLNKMSYLSTFVVLEHTGGYESNPYQLIIVGYLHWRSKSHWVWPGEKTTKLIPSE